MARHHLYQLICWFNFSTGRQANTIVGGFRENTIASREQKLL